MPREVFVAGQVLTAAELNVVSDQSVMVFAGTASRGSAIPSPTEGMMSYLEDSDAVQVYTTGWENVGVTPAILQVQKTVSTANTTGNTAIPFDNTIPQQTEGTEFLTVSITPTSATSLLLVEAVITWAEQTNTYDSATTALFRDAGADALSAQASGNGDEAIPTVLRHFVTAGSTGATTFKIRCGMETTNTVQLNRRRASSSAPIYGSKQESSLTVWEIAQ